MVKDWKFIKEILRKYLHFHEIQIASNQIGVANNLLDFSEKGPRHHIGDQMVKQRLHQSKQHATEDSWQNYLLCQ